MPEGSDQKKDIPARHPEKLREEATEEYYWVQERVMQYEARRFQVKQWSITASGVGFATAILEAAPGLLLVSALGALVFWYIEAGLRSSQNFVALRGALLEAQLRADALDGSPGFYLHYSNHPLSRRLKRILRAAVYVSVMLPHVLIAAAGLLLFLDAAGSDHGVWTQIVSLGR